MSTPKTPQNHIIETWASIHPDELALQWPHLSQIIQTGVERPELPIAHASIELRFVWFPALNKYGLGIQAARLTCGVPMDISTFVSACGSARARTIIALRELGVTEPEINVGLFVL